MELNYQEAKDKLEEWAKECMGELARHKNNKFASSAAVHNGSLIPTDQHIVYTISIGGALMWFGTRDDGSHHQPLIIVTERIHRQHRIGVGHQHIYEALVSGQTNVKKAVKNAMVRAQEIEELGISQSANSVVQKTIKQLQDEELSDVKVPPEITTYRCSDGTYVLHIGTARVNLEQFKKICTAFARR